MSLQFSVPQFLDVEDKLIGPLSIKQFLFIVPGGLIDLALFRIFQIGIIFFVLAIPITLATIGIAFGRFNGKPMYAAFPIFIKFFTTPKRLIFHKEVGMLDDLNIANISVENVASEMNRKPISTEIAEAPTSKLKRLSMLLDQKSEEEYQIIKEKDGPIRK